MTELKTLGGGGASQKTTGEKIVYFVFIFL